MPDIILWSLESISGTTLPWNKLCQLQSAYSHEKIQIFICPLIYWMWYVWYMPFHTWDGNGSQVILQFMYATNICENTNIMSTITRYARISSFSCTDYCSMPQSHACQTRKWLQLGKWEIILCWKREFTSGFMAQPSLLIYSKFYSWNVA